MSKIKIESRFNNFHHNHNKNKKCRKYQAVDKSFFVVFIIVYLHKIQSLTIQCSWLNIWLDKRVPKMPKVKPSSQL